MVESTPLLRERSSKGYRGFESLPLRHLPELAALDEEIVLEQRRDLLAELDPALVVAEILDARLVRFPARR